MTIYGFTPAAWSSPYDSVDMLYMTFATADEAPPEYALVEAESLKDAKVVLFAGGPLLRPAFFKNPAPKPKDDMILLQDLLAECDDILNRIAVMDDKRQRSALRWPRLARRVSDVRRAFGIERR